jgi:hypothetical protein
LLKQACKRGIHNFTLLFWAASHCSAADELKKKVQYHKVTQLPIRTVNYKYCTKIMNQQVLIMNRLGSAQKRPIEVFLVSGEMRKTHADIRAETIDPE